MLRTASSYRETQTGVDMYDVFIAVVLWLARTVEAGWVDRDYQHFWSLYSFSFQTALEQGNVAT